MPQIIKKEQPDPVPAMVELNIETVAKGEEIPDLKSKIGTAVMRKLQKDICERLLDYLDAQKKYDLEIEGLKDKLVDIEAGF